MAAMSAHERGGRRPVHVLTLVDQLGTGGAEALAAALSTGLDRRRFTSSVCVSRTPAPEATVYGRREQEARLGAAGVPILMLSRKGPRDLAAWWPLVKHIRSARVDVLHAHMFGSSVWGTLLGALCRVPVVIAHDHGWSYEPDRLHMLIDRQLLARGSDVIVAVSRENRRQMLEVEHIPPDKALFVANGCPSVGASTGADVRAELGLDPGTPTVGTVCVLRREKALEVLIQAAAILREQIPGVRVLVAGEGPERPRLEALIGDLGLQDTMTLLGQRSDVADVLGALDVAVCCSDWEGSPLALMEYMETERPIVATRVGGIPDIIDDGVHGLLVAPRDPQALASAIGELLADPARGAQMGARARERRQREFTMAAMVKRFEDLYLRLLHARGARLDVDGEVVGPEPGPDGARPAVDPASIRPSRPAPAAPIATPWSPETETRADSPTAPG